MKKYVRDGLVERAQLADLARSACSPDFVHVIF